MFKVCILLGLAIAGAVAQEAAPEPYSYGYQTDTHAASEQRDPQGKVTGFYTLTDGDGRERRVEYIADEGGFRAKIATNEVGTKSENPANVEILASEPTPQQYVVYQQSPPAPQVQVQQAAPQIYRQQFVQQQPQITTTTFQQQPIRNQVVYTTQPQTAQYSYGYYPGYTYGSGYGSGYNSGYGGYGARYGASNLLVGNYNNHLPSQYYRSVSTSGQIVPSSYTTSSGSAYRYVSQPVVSGVRTVSYPGTVSYGVPAGVSSSSSRTVSSGSSGSSNYLVLQKRAAEQKEAEVKETEVKKSDNIKVEEKKNN